jgi:lipopolysaccharide biosynthesis glycosyltransferase
MNFKDAMENFGIIVACYQKDYIFAKACCASIRYFLGDVPICLIVDGDFSPEDLRQTYGVQIIYRQHVSQKVLRDKDLGSSTKMIAFWESPWEKFLYLDADMIVWGDLLKYSNFDHYDLIIDQPRYSYPESEINKWFFDGNQLETFFPDFQWRDRPYFCTGIFFSRRGLFELEEYEQLLMLKLENPKLFYGMDQGLLNLMIFRAADQGKLQLGSAPLQAIVPDFSVDALRQRFPMNTVPLPTQNQEAIAIHWSGKKPFVSRAEVYPQPMTFFRHQFLHDAGFKNPLLNQLTLQLEDWNVYKHKLWHRAIRGRSTSMLR